MAPIATFKGKKATDSKIKKLETTVAELQSKLNRQLGQPTRPQQNDFTIPKYRSPLEYRAPLAQICHICNRSGHIARNCRSPCQNCGRTGHKTSMCRLSRRQNPFCTCIFCPKHGNRLQNNTAQDQNREVNEENNGQAAGTSISDVEMVESKSDQTVIDSHQLAIDKLTVALNAIEIETENEPDPLIKEKLAKHATNIKLQLSQFLTS
uniref:CCHC-type domain-containing protein n=1 Tax=Romanomermis culicivorax TaxID=13658 RepID=A0A915JZI7_ROMCU